MKESLAPFGEDGVVITLAPSVDMGTALASVASALPSSVCSAGRRRILVTHLSMTPEEAMRRLAARATVDSSANSRAAREHLVPVTYDGEDLASVAEQAGLDVAEVIARHTSRAYEATVIGFLPGFAYLESVDPKLVVARLPSPRRRVPALSVAIAGSMTAIYPFASSGGWRLLGRAVLPSLFDAAHDPPGLIQRGDTVRFHAVEHRRPSTPPNVNPDETGGHFEVLRAPAAASVQDLGRARARGVGVPASGPLDEPAMLSANRALGNPASAATIEVPLGRLELRALRSLEVCLDRESPRRIAPGETFVVPSEGRSVRYLAVRGGIDVPPVLGSRATLAVASLGGHQGRYLCRGDRLHVASEDAQDDPSSDTSTSLRETDGHDRTSDDEPLEILPGPDLEDGRVSARSFEELLDGDFHVGIGDRMGVRLDGSKVHRSALDDRGAPEPTVRGVVQLTTDGTPIVLGPDAAITGGYPIVAVLGRRARTWLARRTPGARVRFCVGRGPFA